MEAISIERLLEIVIGLYYFAMGVDGFIKKLPIPTPSERALKFLIALEETQYVLFLVKVIELGVGLAWIMGVQSGLAWLVFTPIWFNIILYHLILNKREVLMPILIFLAHVFLAFKNKNYLALLFC